MDAATPVILQPGEKREQVDIKTAVAAFHCIEGKTFISGRPVSSNFGIQDMALAGTRLVRLHSSSGDDGKYHVCGLPAGSYRLFTDDAFTEFPVAGSDIQNVDLSADPAHLRLRLDWDVPPTEAETPKLDARAEATLRKIAALMGMGDAVSDDDLKGLAIRLRRADPTDAEPWMAISRMPSDEGAPTEMANLMRQLRPMASTVYVALAGTNGLAGVGVGAQVPSEGPFGKGIPAGDYTVGVQSFGPNSPDSAYAKEVSYNGSKLVGDILRVAPAANGTLHIVLVRDMSVIGVNVTDSDGKPLPNSTVVIIPESVTSVPLLSRASSHGQTDENGFYGSQPLAPGKYRVLATTQAIRWGVPDDLQKVLLVLFQAKDVELDGKATVQITIEPIPM